MVKVPTYQSRVPVPDAGAGAPRLDPGAYAAGGRGLFAAGAAIQDTAQIVRRSDEHAATQEAARTVAETRAAWVERGHEMQQSAPEGAPGFVKQLTTAFDKDAAARMKNASPLAREIIELNMIGVRGSLVSKALAFETNSRLNKQLRDLNTTLTTEANSVRLDDTLFAQALNNGVSAIAGSQISEDNKALATNNLNRDLARAVYQGLIDRNPEAARARLEAGEFKDFIPEGDFNTLLHQSTAALEHKRRVAASELAPLLKDHLASLERTGVGLPGVSFRAPAALPADKLAEFRRDEALATETFNVVSRIRFAPPEAINTELGRVKPSAGSRGFADRQRVYDHLVTVTGRMMGERAKDPAGYAMQSPEIAAAFQAVGQVADADERAGAAARALSARMNFQKSIGIARPALLSDAEAQETVTRIHAMPPADQALNFTSLIKSYGPHASQAMQELSAKGLDTRFMVLASIGDDLVASADLANAIKTGPQELRKSIDPADKTTVRGELHKHIRDFKAVFEGGDPSGGAARKMNEIFSAIEDLAVHYVRQGKSPEDAAAEAHRIVIGDRYNIIRTDTIRAAVPTRLGDPDALTLAAGDMQAEDQIRAFNPRPFGDPGAPEFLSVERTVRTATNSGYWVTDETGTGMVLMVPFRGGGALPLVNKRGERYRIPFADPPLTPQNRARLLERGAMP